MEKSYYVYILQSEVEQTKHYTGYTKNITKRLNDHNAKKCIHTSKYAPWKLETLFTFSDYRKAINFEKYLKSPSGRAFAKKRL